MAYFFYGGKLYYSLLELTRELGLSYEGVRYALRPYGTKKDYMRFLHENPEFINMLIDRYKAKENNNEQKRVR